MSSVAVTAETAEQFKQAMRRLTTTITIIATSSGGERFGMTATAVCSVSADPPAIAVCINRSASIHAAIRQAKLFSVNLLNPVHTELVFPFSGKRKGEERFDIGKWGRHHEDIPVLQNALSSFLCRLGPELDYGTHTLFVGEVLHVQLGDDNSPLLWRDSGFALVEVVK